jgi:hypothetical protein
LKVIVAGSRSIADQGKVEEVLDRLEFPITEVVSGCAIGPDRFGEAWARRRGVPVKTFRPNWTLLGAAAGPVRNKAMAAYGDVLVAFWNGVSPGTDNMIKTMRRLGKPVVVFELPTTPRKERF